MADTHLRHGVPRRSGFFHNVSHHVMADAVEAMKFPAVSVAAWIREYRGLETFIKLATQQGIENGKGSGHMEGTHQADYAAKTSRCPASVNNNHQITSLTLTTASRLPRGSLATAAALGAFGK